MSFGALDAIRERPGTDFRVEGDAGFWGRTGAFVGFGWSAKADAVDAYAGLRRYAGTYGRGAYGGISAGGRFVGEPGESGPEWSTAAELGWEGRYGGMLGLGFAFQAALRDIADRENRRIDVSLSARMRATAPDDSREYAAYLWTRDPGDKWVKLSAYPPGAVSTTMQFETLFDLELGLAPGIAAAFQWGRADADGGYPGETENTARSADHRPGSGGATAAGADASGIGGAPKADPAGAAQARRGGRRAGARSPAEPGPVPQEPGTPG